MIFFKIGFACCAAAIVSALVVHMSLPLMFSYAVWAAVVGRASCRSTWTCSSTASTRYVPSTHAVHHTRVRGPFDPLVPQSQCTHRRIASKPASDEKPNNPSPRLLLSPSLWHYAAGDVEGRDVPQLPERELDWPRVRLRLCTSLPSIHFDTSLPVHSSLVLGIKFAPLTSFSFTSNPSPFSPV